MKKILIILSLIFAFSFSQACEIPLNLNKNNFKGNESIVQKIQLILASDYDLYRPGLTTGYFGSLTKTGIQNLQSRYGLSPTGTIDSKTQSILCQMLEKNICPINGYNYSVGSSDFENKNNDIILIQQLISNNPEYHTGYFGNVTKSLLQNFQSQFGLTQTGVFDFDTYQFICSILTNKKTESITQNNVESSKEIPDFSKSNIVKYLKSELIGKTLNILLDTSNLINDEEIIISFNQNKKGTYKKGDIIEIIYNLEKKEIHQINQTEKLSFFQKIKKFLTASISDIHSSSNTIQSIIDLLSGKYLVDWNNNVVKITTTTLQNSDQIIIQPQKTETLKGSDYYLPVKLNIASPYLRYFEYGLGKSFAPKAYDFSVFENHSFRNSFVMRDYSFDSGIKSSPNFMFDRNKKTWTVHPFLPFSTEIINKYVKENSCEGIKQIPFYAMYIECPGLSEEAFVSKINEPLYTCCQDWFLYLQENPITNWYFNDSVILESIKLNSIEARKNNSSCFKSRAPKIVTQEGLNNGNKYEGEYGKCVRQRTERILWELINSGTCQMHQEVKTVNIDCTQVKYNTQTTTTTKKQGMLYSDKYIWKCDNVTKKCFITETGNYLSKEQCEDYCSKDFQDNSNLYSFGSTSYYSEKINLQILNKDGKVFEKDFYIIQD